ncbi:MAG: tripartite tricarboxylate transporter substrate binding protein [Betaproteobacteria bacterium]|nr:tripartite tricarboxylate transporter substrate binding protein [Betaproteobacteria bacterium]
MRVKKWGRSAILLVWLALVFGVASTWGASFPERPVRFLVGFNPGGGTDQVARIIAPKLSERWAQSVIVENRPGADGDIALGILMSSEPDGYTLVMATNAFTITPNLRKLNYDPIKSFSPIILVASVPGVLAVRGSLPVSSLKELIALAKSKPGQLNFASSGTGTTPYLQMALLMKLTGIDMVHIPYKGNVGPPLLSGEVDMGFSGVPALLALVKAGRIKALAVSTTERAAQLPEVPTVAEAANLPGYEAFTWYGVLGRVGTPKEIINKLNADISEVMRDPTARQRISNSGFLIVAGSPEKFSATIKSDVARWSALLKTIDIVK